MDLKNTKAALKTVILSNLKMTGGLHIIPILMSKPGIGKTEIVKAVCEELGINLILVILAQFDSGELGGFPMLDKENSKFDRAKPFFMHFEDNNKDTVIFLDELPQSPVANQNIAAQLVNERRIGEHMLPDNVTIICAGNNIEDRAGTNAMPSHLRDRLTFIPVETDTDSFLDHAYAKGFNDLVTGFLLHRPEMLSVFNSADQVNASPRSWERAGTILDMGLDKIQENEFLKGQIGKSAVADFIGYIAVARQLPNPKEALKNPDSVKIPTDSGVLYALTSGLASNTTDENSENLIKIITRFEKKEFAAVTIKALCKRNRAMLRDKHISAWLMGEGKALMG